MHRTSGKQLAYIEFVSDGFDAHPSHLPQTPSARAAGLIRAALIFRQNLKRGLLQPDSTKEGPLCMDTYRCVLDIVPKPDSPMTDS